MITEKTILDMCCGGRMFWFDREDPRAVFCDIRSESIELCDGRIHHVKPDVICDFRSLPFADESFSLVVFDPPHFNVGGNNGWQVKKYGRLNKDTWKHDLSKGFSEAFRVLKPGCVLIFKWNETQIKTKQILDLTPEIPVFGHPSGKRANTHWITFIKS